MAKRSWVIADTHFSHVGITQFSNKDGSKTRPWDDPNEMDEAIVAAWNALVPPGDRVYVLGDVAINKRGLEPLGRCNGRKVLVKGNHDIFKLRDYLPYFEDIRGSVVRHVDDQRVILTHIPIHTRELDRFSMNIHGHLHAEKVMLEKPCENFVDPRYVCVSVEQTGYHPIPLEEAMSRGQRRQISELTGRPS